MEAKKGKAYGGIEIHSDSCMLFDGEESVGMDSGRDGQWREMD